MKLHMPDGQINEDPIAAMKAWKKPVAIYSGSFNPLHEGHVAIYDLLVYNGYTVCFEISRARRNKESYTDEEMNQRLEQFSWKYPVLETDLMYFIDKYEALKDVNASFAMGYDTAERLLKDGNFNKEMKFVLVGRMTNGVYYDAKQLVPLFGKCECVTFDMRKEVSSTAIRKSKET